MVAIRLIKGNLTTEDYVANDPHIDTLRDKMEVSEEPCFTKEYLEDDKRAIGNSIQVFFYDGTSTDNFFVDYFPLGHRRRREGILLLKNSLN